jgi:HPt (histidine-containing phosphotransfer) domain-containing protein
MNDLTKIPGLDYEKGIKQVDGKEDDYLKILKAYMTGTKNKLAVLENTSKDNLRQYEITVHGVKGSSLLIYAQKIGEQAATLEKAAVAGDLDFINKHNPELLKHIKDLIQNLEAVFRKIDAEKVRVKKDKPDIETLKKLADACDIFDMLEVEAAMTEISSYEYKSDNDLVDWLQRSVDDMQ